MPLVVFCGHPASGKTAIAHELIQYLQSHNPSLNYQLLNHETLSLSRSLYANPFLEKKLRAELKSAIERELTQQRLVVVDWINSIKGFRYELFCRSKEAATQHCVVFIDTAVEQCLLFNQQRHETLRYQDNHFNDLLGRLETPNSKNRWDSPLFTIKPTEMGDGEKASVYESINDFLSSGHIHQPTVATISQKSEGSDFLFQLDKLTLICIQTLLRKQQSGEVMIGDSIVVHDSYRDVKVELSRRVVLGELKRLQQQFVQMAKIRPPQGQRQIVVQFVQHLNEAIARE